MQINFARHKSRREPTAISGYIASRMRPIIRPLTLVLARARALAILIAVYGIGFATPVLAIDLPAWAYPFNPPGYKPTPDDGVLRRVPGSVVIYPLSQTRERRIGILKITRSCPLSSRAGACLTLMPAAFVTVPPGRAVPRMPTSPACLLTTSSSNCGIIVRACAPPRCRSGCRRNS